MGLRSVLEHPLVYQAFQQGFGFFNARVFAVRDYLDIKPGQTVIDIGCGPGFIVRHLPQNVDYTGFDIDQRYIDFAKQRFGDRGRFHCRYFDDACAAEFYGADLVMMNGVLHHIPDADLATTLQSIAKVLKPSGLLFTLDGCYRPGQNWFAKYLLDKDRGQYVRTEDGYRRLLEARFPSVAIDIFEDKSMLPYTFIFTRCRLTA